MTRLNSIMTTEQLMTEVAKFNHFIGRTEYALEQYMQHPTEDNFKAFVSDLNNAAQAKSSTMESVFELALKVFSVDLRYGTMSNSEINDIVSDAAMLLIPSTKARVPAEERENIIRLVKQLPVTFGVDAAAEELLPNILVA